MPRRQVANLEFTLGTVTTEAGSSGTGWVALGVPFSLFHIYGAQADSTGTFAGTVYGATSSGGTTGNTYVLATISDSTTRGYNSSAIPCSWLMYMSSALPTSTSNNTLTVSVACAG